MVSGLERVLACTTRSDLTPISRWPCDGIFYLMKILVHCVKKSLVVMRPTTEVPYTKRPTMENVIASLIKGLLSDDGIERQRARLELVKIGKPAISLLIGLQYSRQQQVRWEAIKTLSQIADPDAVPILVNALENSNSDVRWLAAEGLVEIGKASVSPVMEALEERGDSKILREGVHHVLKDLERKGVFEDSHDIIGILEDPSKQGLLRPTAEKIRSKK